MIDLTLAIYHISPDAEYLLSSTVPPHDIIEWRGPGEQPTEAELDAAYLDIMKIILAQRLDDEMHQYLIDRGYTRNEREGLQSSYTNIMQYELQGSLTEHQQTAKSRIEAAWTFVDEVVLTYYYTKKLEIEAATDLESISWNFSSLDAQDPEVRLQEIKYFLI